MLNNPSNNTIFNHIQFNNLTNLTLHPTISPLFQNNQLQITIYHYNTQTSSLLLFPNTTSPFLTITSPSQLQQLTQYISSITNQLQSKQILLFYIISNPQTNQYYQNFHFFINQTLNIQPTPNKLPPSTPSTSPTSSFPTPIPLTPSTPTPSSTPPSPTQPNPTPTSSSTPPSPLPPINL